MHYRQNLRRLQKPIRRQRPLIAKRSSSKICDGLVGAVGNTPLVKLRYLSEQTGCNVLAKAELLNPGGSVKDRAALGIIRDAENKGILKPGGTVIEGTAGNTGIGMAHVCKARGYKLVIYMPDNQSPEKISTLKSLGATVIPVPVAPFDNPANYNHQARRHAESTPNAVWGNQFDNTANKQFHFTTTGPEIWAQTEGKVDGWTVSTGTGGTYAGVAEFLKSKNSKIKCYIADPPGSVLYSYATTGKLERSGSSITEGIGQGRITDNMKNAPFDGGLFIDDRRTIRMIFDLFHYEGFLVGASSALNVVAAYDLAKLLGPGHTVVTVLCDSIANYRSRLLSQRWLSTKGLLDEIPKEYHDMLAQ